ncbi:hypothetical protein [Streptomyces jumonjinensis]
MRVPAGTARTAAAERPDLAGSEAAARRLDRALAALTKELNG